MSLEWSLPAIVLDARPYGEGGAIATVLTPEGGARRGLVRGGSGRTHSATWQVGNLIHARWTARVEGQLGTLTGEAAAQPAGVVLDDPLGLAVLRAACAVAAGALPEREPHGRVFVGLADLLIRLAPGRADMAALIRWEAALLDDLGYGLDLSACAQTGALDDLAWVSPRTGRALSADAAASAAMRPYRDRLLPLPPLLLDDTVAGDAAQWADGLRLTGHFLARDAFGITHRPLPPARIELYDRVVRGTTPNG